MSKPKKTPTIIEAIKHKSLFGSLPAFQSLDSWTSWLTWLKAVFALPMDEADLAIYRQCTGRTDTPTAPDPDNEDEPGFDIPLVNARFSIYRPSTNREDDPQIVAPPTTAPREIFMISGRRSGKSFISSLVATYLACFSNYAKHLNAGERAVILVLARDRDQGRVCFAYIAGIIREIAPLAAMVVSERADEIELDNGTVIMVKTSDFRSVRGLTLAAVICDEVAFWDSQGVSPDAEIFRALKPAMATIPDSKLIAISSPYAMSGVLYEAHRDFFGKNDSNVLVWQSETRVMNPLIDADLIQRELERDPDSAKSEWLATFRDDLEAAFSLESLRACVIPGRSELPSSSAIAYSGFVDPSGGRHDAFTVAIGHRENDGVVVDLVKAWYPPFDPSMVVAEISDILSDYGIASIIGDNYAGEWPVESFKHFGIAYERSEKHKSELYLSLIPTVNAKLVELPDHHKLIEELRRLERRRGRSGKDSIDHPPRLSDDLANSVAGLVHLVLNNEDGGSSGFNPRFHVSGTHLLPVRGEPVFIGTTLVSPWASVIAQNQGSGVQILAAFVTEVGGLRHHLQQQVAPWLHRHAQWALRYRNNLCGAYSDDGMTLLELQTIYAGLEEILKADWQQPTQLFEGRLDAVHKLLSSTETYTFRPKFQVNPEATLIAQALSRPPDLKTIHGAVQNALSLVIDRIAPNAPQCPKEVRVITGSGPILWP